jgi:hypothetical protein
VHFFVTFIFNDSAIFESKLLAVRRSGRKIEEGMDANKLKYVLTSFLLSTLSSWASEFVARRTDSIGDGAKRGRHE